MARNPRLPEILERLAVGESGRSIAPTVGLTMQRIYQIARKYGVRPCVIETRRQRRLAAEAAVRNRRRAELDGYYRTLADKIRELHLAGYTQTEIAPLMGMSQCHVGRILLAHYPDQRQKKYSPRRARTNTKVGK